MQRSSGILMPISSLPSKYGIGTFGKEARRFAKFLKKAGQKYWQILPLGPTGYGDSPYQSFSSFAGNPYLIDIETLIEEGLLTYDEAEAFDFGTNPERVDYGALYNSRFALLKIATRRCYERYAGDIQIFVAENASWLLPYAEFMARKKANGMKPWTEWNESVGYDENDALFFKCIQYIFFKQWKSLKEYVNSLGISIIGDIPLYVSMDSVEVWSEPTMFKLYENNYPVVVSGVPPDYFNADGQLWGNPIYDYEKMRQDGYKWWVNRIGGAAKLFDVMRIDHFRGIASYWEVPFGAENARTGRWVEGPRMELVNALKQSFPEIEFIAEDLGEITPDVGILLKESGLPGMKVLEYAFSPYEINDYLPHRTTENFICYTGTHDNSPLQLWRKQVPEEEIAFAKRYLGLNDEEGFNEGIIRGGMSCPAVLFVAQMQDWLNLGSEESRINFPGTDSGNWQWRMKSDALTDELAEKIHEMTRIYSRL